ncbi:MAG: hypothetical protein ACE5I1_15630 [bacterium]
MTKNRKKYWIVTLLFATIAGFSALNLLHADLHPFLNARGFCFICESPVADFPPADPRPASLQMPKFGPVASEFYEVHYAEPIHDAIKSRAPPFPVSNDLIYLDNNYPFETRKRRFVLCRNLQATDINRSV